MPRSCSICSHERASEISKELAAGASVRGIASRFKVTAASAHRHLNNCLRIVRSAEKPGQGAAPKGSADSSRFDSEGRCRTCGQLGPEADASMLDAPAIVRRAESLLARSERVADQAEGDGDLRLVLSAVDRCQRSIDTLAKIAGILQPDNSVTVNVAVDATKKLNAWLGSLPESTLRAFVAGSCPNCHVNLTGESIDAEIGTDFRDQKALTA
jgi:hypothetical protein